MKKILILIFVLTASVIHSESTPTPTPLLPGKWIAAKVPWDLWFKNNAHITDDTEYIHFFWNANDFKANFEVKDKKSRLADAAFYLVKNLYPPDSKTDLVKVDIVYVLERDEYGMPQWDTMKKVLHVEFLKSKIITNKKLPNFSTIEPDKVFEKFQIFNPDDL